MFGLSFNKSKQVADSSSQSTQIGGSEATSFGNSGQTIAFQDLFQKLFGGANAAANGVNSGGLSEVANQLFSGGSSFLDSLQDNTGLDALESRAGDTTARDANLDVLKTSLGDFFNEQLIPGIASEGIATGTYGGSRGDVAKAQAAKAVSGQFATGAASILNADQAQRDAAAANLGGLKVQGAQVGTDLISQMFGLAQGGATAGLLPYQILSQIMGGPTTLTDSESGSQSYGFDFGSSTSQSHSQGSSIGVGLGIPAGGGGKVGG